MQKSRIHQLVHGTPNKPRYKQPSMFEILSWNGGQSQNVPQIKLNVQQLNRYSNQSNYNHQNINSPLISNTITHNNLYKQDNRINIINSNRTEQQNDLNRNTIKSLSPPKRIKHELYMYQGDSQRKRRQQQQEQDRINERNKRLAKKVNKSQMIKRQQMKSLDPINDKAEITKRKKKIKQFQLYTRELPNSAFTTYYGKPAFGNYGSGNKSKSIDKRKSFNIMPHAGQNHPEYIQTFETALAKGKQIKQNFIPKKALIVQTQQVCEKQKQKLRATNSQYYHISIKKPDLVNTLRFSQDKSLSQQHKAKTPLHNQLNWIPSRQQPKFSKMKKVTCKDTKKLKKVTSTNLLPVKRQQYSTINKRDHLKQILTQKKRQTNRLAYKVTQCYPLPYNNLQQTQQQQQAYSTKMSRWSEMRPAGIHSPRSEHMRDVFYYNTSGVYY